MSDSIESAISSSIASLPGSDASTSSSASSSDSSSPDTSTGDTTATDTTATDTPVATTTDGQPPAVETVDPNAAAAAAVDPNLDPDSLEGLAKEMAGKRDNRIPHSRVTKIVDNQVKKAVAQVEQKYARYNTPEFQNEQAAMKVADTNPEQFLQAIVKIDPRYADLLAGAKVLGGGGVVQSEVVEKKPVAAATAENVEPDIQLSDGTLAYSAEAQQRREEALVARVTAQFEEQFEKRFGERFKDVEPIVAERRQSTMRREAEQRVEQRIEKATKWPGFNENKEAIGAAVMEATRRGEFLDLHDAYIQVVIPKFKADEAAQREKIVAEMNKAAAAAGRVGPAGGEAPKKEAAGSDDDAITAAIKESIRKVA